jgi:hypothetical protein
MPRSRPASNPVYHKHTGQYYVTRAGKRIYLGSDRDQALRRYHEIGLGIETAPQAGPTPLTMTLKELANRFLAAQRANWCNRERKPSRPSYMILKGTYGEKVHRTFHMEVVPVAVGIRVAVG